MRCVAYSRQRKQQCSSYAVRGMTVCRMHGGSTPRGIAAPQWKTGRYSKHLPQRLLPRYHEALDDQSWASLRNEIAVMDSRITELLGQLDTGEAGALWSTLTKRWQELLDARAAGEPLKISATLNAVGDAIEAGASEQARWFELAKHIDQRRGLVESERKRVVELQQVMTLEQAAGVFQAITEAIKRHVTDRTALAGISAELSRIIGGADGARVGNGG